MTMKKGCGLFAAAALVAVLSTSHSFSFAPQRQQRCPSAQFLAEKDDIQESTNAVSERRGFLSQIAATATVSASLLLSSSPQKAHAFVNNEPTRIELSVDTDYLIRVLDYFDGDMRKVLGVMIRAPSTSVEIDAPSRGSNRSINPKDAILSALSSYNEEEYAVQQASWVKVDKPNRTLDLLLKKRYTLSVPSLSSDKNAEQMEIVLKDGGNIRYQPAKLESTSFSLSNMEAAVGLAVVSYPVAYGVYNYESWQEEEDKKLKKAQMAAKKAAKAKGEAKAKSKGTPKKKEKEASDGNKSKQVMKGQEAKKSPTEVDVNFDGKGAEWFLSETALISKMDDTKNKEPPKAKAETEAEEQWWKVKPSETVVGSDANGNDQPADATADTSGSEWFGRDVSESTIMALIEDAEAVVMQQGGYLDNLSRSQASASLPPPPRQQQQGGYLENLSRPPPQRQGQGGYLDNLPRQAVSKKTSGSFGSYLDSL